MILSPTLQEKMDEVLVTTALPIFVSLMEAESISNLSEDNIKSLADEAVSRARALCVSAVKLRERLEASL